MVLYDSNELTVAVNTNAAVSFRVVQRNFQRAIRAAVVDDYVPRSCHTFALERFQYIHQKVLSIVDGSNYTN